MITNRSTTAPAMIGPIWESSLKYFFDTTCICLYYITQSRDCQSFSREYLKISTLYNHTIPFLYNHTISQIAPRPQTGREAAPSNANLPNRPKTSLHGNRRSKSEKSFTNQSGGCRAGKFGEGQGGLEGREPLSRGLPAPPRSSYSFPRYFFRKSCGAMP